MIWGSLKAWSKGETDTNGNMGPELCFHNLLLGIVTLGSSTASFSFSNPCLFISQNPAFRELSLLAISWVVWFVLSTSSSFQVAYAHYTFPPGPGSLTFLPSQISTIPIVRQCVTLPWENCKSEE